MVTCLWHGLDSEEKVRCVSGEAWTHGCLTAEGHAPPQVWVMKAEIQLWLHLQREVRYVGCETALVAACGSMELHMALLVGTLHSCAHNGSCTGRTVST